jgi:hypothetical protein
MAISLGKDGAAPPFGAGVISASYTEEQELVDVTNRDNCGGTAGNPGYKANMAGFTTKTWEIECHDADSVITSLTAQATAGQFSVMSVTENIGVDGAVTFTVTAKEG